MESIKNIKPVLKSKMDERKQTFQKMNPGRVLNIKEFVKLAIVEDETCEYLWFQVIKIIGKDKYQGRCDNVPVMLKKIKF
jgi:hypothetical protein